MTNNFGQAYRIHAIGGLPREATHVATPCRLSGRGAGGGFYCDSLSGYKFLVTDDDSKVTCLDCRFSLDERKQTR